MIKGYEQG